jgi:hypothetical protein
LKDKTQHTFFSFANEAQSQRDSKIFVVKSHNGLEFKNYTMEEFLSGEGIKHQYFAAYNPSKHGVEHMKNESNTHELGKNYNDIVQVSTQLLDQS